MVKPLRPDTRLVGFVTWEIARRLYRWRRLNIGVRQRLERLQEQLTKLPRTGIGVLLKDVDPALDERLRPMREHDRELVIGDFDMDGALLPRFGELAGIPVIVAAEFVPRTDAQVLLVDLNGRLGVRKEFGSNVGRFVQEIEALVHLEGRGCPVPRLMNVDWHAHSITETFVPGAVVRELLAEAGANIRDRDVRASGRMSRHRVRVGEGRRYVQKIMSEQQVAAVAAGLNAIHSAGFVLEDVKFGNLILAADSGEPIFVDLERALPIGSLPRALADHLIEVDLRKFRDHFGQVPGSGRAGQ